MERRKEGEGKGGRGERREGGKRKRGGGKGSVKRTGREGERRVNKHKRLTAAFSVRKGLLLVEQRGSRSLVALTLSSASCALEGLWGQNLDPNCAHVWM